MAFVQVQCPDCHSADVVQYGKTGQWDPALSLRQSRLSARCFSFTIPRQGRLPAVKQQIIDMTLNGSAVRDIVVSCGSVQPRVVDVLKKKPTIKQVNERLLKSFDPAQLDIILRQVKAAEMDEMWSFVGSKSQPRWLWHAIEPSHRTALSV